jgi:extradiol dioxygenase family protein
MSGILKSVAAARIFVGALDRARRFYGDVLELPEKSATSERVVFDLDGKDIVVEVVASDDPERDLVGRFLAVSFTVDDVDAAYRHLTAKGVSFVQAPEKQAWGGTLAFPAILTATS